MLKTIQILALLLLFNANFLAQTPNLRIPGRKVIEPTRTGKTFKSIDELKLQGEENLEKNRLEIDKVRESLEKQKNVPKMIDPDSSNKTVKRITPETDSLKGLNQNAIYNRPFIGIGSSKTAIGGYLEANLNYFITDGVSEGFSMEMRRFNVFLYSSISKRIRFLSELEFEHGTKEINLETAIIDFNIHPSFNFRGGILLPQIGIFNANHDSPQWDFVDRPLSSTLIIPSTLSEVGFGFFGKFFLGNNVLSYNANATNGLQDGVVYNESGRTFLGGGKSPEIFAEDNNGEPMLNARISIANRNTGEIGLAYYGGVYNTYKIEGEVFDAKRRVDLIAVDFNANVLKGNITGEYVWNSVDIPAGITDIYGEIQNGGFIDFKYPVISGKFLNYKSAQLFASIRGEVIDLNYGKFELTNSPKRDEIWSNTLGIGFRPTNSTIFKLNYRYIWNFDLIGNPPSQTAGLQFGFASYF
ncbi:MAG: hypothetical protein MRY83_10015 [Flavobacteriales bacterium]|nr:hypothetical protein [Flavobacteriales bacterium]